ncbi:hypothetical protein FVE85_5097 [Porphyridium purpureum]|uniref:Uncharacterized protein n=1 Tax=Porphyridium purpureum TaxID=35688 RepID=A0A5J4Z2W1_PORPP|nr:hypothetical protein FVE85_5097 [Porphyridium purpureum]|eukprot:POR4270..scf295_1
MEKPKSNAKSYIPPESIDTVELGPPDENDYIWSGPAHQIEHQLEESDAIETEVMDSKMNQLPIRIPVALPTSRGEVTFESKVDTGAGPTFVEKALFEELEGA